MLPAILFGSCSSHSNSRKKIKSNRRNYEETEEGQLQLRSIPAFNIDPIISKHSTSTCCLRCTSNNRGREAGNIKKMANKVSNFSDLIQRVTASCLLHPLGSGRHYADTLSAIHSPDVESDEEDDTYIKTHEDEELEEEEDDDDDVAALEGRRSGCGPTWRDSVAAAPAPADQEMGMLMGKVFEAVSNMKRAYVSLQEAHTPWDPERMRMADVAVVGELRRLGVLRERFRRSCVGAGRGGSGRRVGVLTGTTSLREVVAPYEATVERLRREVKSREAEVEALREKLKTATSLNNNHGGRKGKPSHQSKRRVSCTSQVIASPMPELFEATMSSVKEASKSFTSQLLSLMKAAHWDIAAAVRSIEAAAASTTTTAPTAATMDSIVGPNHAKYALESYVNRKVFQGFDHETFYMDGSLSSLLNPDQFRHECFTQFCDMKAMDPMELLGILPTCQFGKFCSKKYLSIVHPKMEESLFGDLDQRRQVLDGNHPRSRFYGEFLGLAKAVWLLHLLAFALEPPPSYFEGTRGAEYHSQYMESVVRFPGGRVAPGQVVGFPVGPGFKLGDGSVVKARVYLVPKNGF